MLGPTRECTCNTSSSPMCACIPSTHTYKLANYDGDWHKPTVTIAWMMMGTRRSGGRLNDYATWPRPSQSVSLSPCMASHGQKQALSMQHAQGRWNSRFLRCVLQDHVWMNHDGRGGGLSRPAKQHLDRFVTNSFRRVICNTPSDHCSSQTR